MSLIKQLIAKNFQSLTYFYRQLRYRLFLMISLNVIVGILDGFGLAMFMPLLEMVNQTNQAKGESMGNLHFIVDIMKSLGISLNLLSVLAVMVLFFSVKGVANFISQAYQAVNRQFFISNMRIKILQAFNQVRFKYFVTSDVGRIQNTMTVEVERSSAAFYNYANTIDQAVIVIVYMGFAFFIEIRFAVLVSIGGWLTNFLYKLIYKKTKGASLKFTKDSHFYQGLIIQHVANFKYLKATAFLQPYAERLRISIHSIEQSRRKIGILNAILGAAREPLLIIVVAGVIIIQTLLLHASLGPILVSLLFFYRALSTLLNLQNSYNRFLELYGSLENVIGFQNEIINQKEQNGRQTIEALNSFIELKDVYFAYDKIEILKNINLRIEKNETIAFVGESGSGKTTLVNILAGLMPVDSGTMLVDGIDRNELDIISYQKRLGYITQEPVIFNDSIFNNVTLWDNCSEENFKRFDNAVKMASIKEFIDDQPLGKETILGNNGINVSGGQRQRISIARELYKNIDILIMDEATSALDSDTERAIQESIDGLKGNYTILLVAHRLSTVRNADRIVLMNKGKIENIGSYNELINTSALFKKMVELQEI